MGDCVEILGAIGFGDFHNNNKNFPEDSAWRPVTVLTFLSTRDRVWACPTPYATRNGHWTKVGKTPKER